MPANNRIPLSVRIGQEEADFIAALQIDGAFTLSDKIRELLKQARQAHEVGQDYAHALAQAERAFLPVRHSLLQAEQDLGVHSAILARLLELLPDWVAMAMTEGAQLQAEPESLRAYEAAMMTRAVRLMEGVLQLLLGASDAAYDETVLQQLDNVLKLAQIVQQQKQAV